MTLFPDCSVPGTCARAGRTLRDVHAGLPATFAMLDDHSREDAAAHVKTRCKPHVTRTGGGHQIIQNVIGDSFVVGALVAKGPDVEFQPLQLDTSAIRHVIEKECCEIRLAGHGAQAGELRDLHADEEIAIRAWIAENRQLLALFRGLLGWGIRGHEKPFAAFFPADRRVENGIIF